jgi:two-component system sensor histidine kinase PilS (NtrC family)
LIFTADVIALSLLTLAMDGPNLHLSLLFVITIFAASLLLDAKGTLIITLIAVISVVYQLFLGSLFDFSSLNNIGNSALLAFLFCRLWQWSISSSTLPIVGKFKFFAIFGT